MPVTNHCENLQPDPCRSTKKGRYPAAVLVLSPRGWLGCLWWKNDQVIVPNHTGEIRTAATGSGRLKSRRVGGSSILSSDGCYLLGDGLRGIKNSIGPSGRSLRPSPQRNLQAIWSRRQSVSCRWATWPDQELEARTRTCLERVRSEESIDTRVEC